MDTVWNYTKDTVLYVLGTLLHNAPVLIIGILIAAAMMVYVNMEKLRNWLMRRSSVSIPASVTFGAFTPFCACGTMAVVLAMLATALPWGPVMAFLTSSPLMSPDGFVLISGIIGLSFATALAAASVIIGAGSGYITHFIEKKTHFLDNQLRLAAGAASASSGSCGCGVSAAPAEQACSCGDNAAVEQACGCGGNAVAEEHVCGCGAAAEAVVRPKTSVSGFIAKYKLGEFAKAVFDLGIKKILPYFAVFAGIGYLINRFIPSDWISVMFGSQSVFAVPLAAVIGLPLYVNGDSSIPLIQSLMQSGVSAGAMLAFLITGPGTSAGVMAGIAAIMKKRAIALYAVLLLVGAILVGYGYELVLAFI